MDTSPHNLATLFDQLGLPSSEAEIESFIRHHRQTLIPQLRIEQAGFWTSAQADFLHEAVAEDSDWCEVVDELDALLRTMPH